jgi:hypothetical protein
VVAILFTDKAVKTVVKGRDEDLKWACRWARRTPASVRACGCGHHHRESARLSGAALVKLQRGYSGRVGSVLGKQVLIKDMKLDNMEVFIEQKGLQNNLYQVIKPLRELHEPTGKGLIIDNLEITNVTVHAGLTVLPGQPPSVDLKLASIRMVDVGRNEKVDAAVLISKILLAVAAGIAEQGGNILPSETIGDLGSILDKAIDIGKIIFGPGKTVTDGIKDLFGGKKKQ